MKRDRKGTNRRDIVIRREEAAPGQSHGGAWKVAYADFVTAMMAFFLLMWLVNATTEEQRRGIANYFSPISALGRSESGSGAPFGGRTPYDPGPMVSESGAVQVVAGTLPPVRDPPEDDADAPVMHPSPRSDGPAPPSVQGAQEGGPGKDRAAKLPVASAPTAAVAVSPQPVSAADPAAAERASFAAAARGIRAVIDADPALKALAGQLSVDITPDGLRVQIMDTDSEPMFATGSVEPTPRAQMLLRKIAPVLAKLSEPIAISGYTDAAPYRGGDRTNWDLSAGRANATRRLLRQAGLPEGRIQRVTGYADRDLLLPADPLAAANRRIAILVLRTALAHGALGTAGR